MEERPAGQARPWTEMGLTWEETDLKQLAAQICLQKSEQIPSRSYLVLVLNAADFEMVKG